MHAPGARVVVGLDCEPTELTVWVRDDGPGFGPGRLETAAAEGRLGVSRSILERMAAVGGRATVSSGPDGVEVLLVVP
jgi:signal transduction histidine kinase